MPQVKIVRTKELLVMLGVSKSTIYDWINPRSRRYNGFPAPIKIGISAVGWELSSIEDWLSSRPKKGTN